MTTTVKGKSSVVSVEALLGQQGELFKRLLKESLQEVLEAEMTEVVALDPANPRPSARATVPASVGGYGATFAPALEVGASPRDSTLGQAHGRWELVFGHEPIDRGTAQPGQSQDHVHTQEDGGLSVGDALLKVWLSMAHLATPVL